MALLLGLVATACRMPHVEQFAPEPAAGNTAVEDPSSPATGDAPAITVEPPELQVLEGGAASYQVALAARPAGMVTVTVTNPCAELSVTPDRLLFAPANWTASQSISVAAAEDTDALADSSIELNHTASGGGYGGTAAPPVRVTIVETETGATGATGTIEHDDTRALGLTSLQVTGGGSMYPAFAAEIHHYALTCDSSIAVRITAEAANSSAQLTLLRDDPDANHTSTGTLDVTLNAANDHDFVIEVSDTEGTQTFVVHCLPPDFPDIRILSRTDAATDGLLFITPQQFQTDFVRFRAVVDLHGVPRYHAREGVNFRPQPNGPTINGTPVRYSVDLSGNPRLLDRHFGVVHTVKPAGEITSVDPHDFVMTDDGNAVLIAYHTTTRDLSRFTDADGTRGTMSTSKETAGSPEKRYAPRSSMRV